MSSLQKKRKGQKSTGYTTAQNGTKSDEKFQKFSRSWSKKHEPQRRSGSDKEVLLRILSVKAMAPCWGTLASGGACGWAVVQLDYDEQMGPLHGMYGSTEAEYEVQRTIKRGGGDSLLAPPQESMWTYQAFMWTTRE